VKELKTCSIEVKLKDFLETCNHYAKELATKQPIDVIKEPNVLHIFLSLIDFLNRLLGKLKTPAVHSTLPVLEEILSEMPDASRQHLLTMEAAEVVLPMITTNAIQSINLGGALMVNKVLQSGLPDTIKQAMAIYFQGMGFKVAWKPKEKRIITAH